MLLIWMAFSSHEVDTEVIFAKTNFETAQGMAVERGIHPHKAQPMPQKSACIFKAVYYMPLHALKYSSEIPYQHLTETTASFVDAHSQGTVACPSKNDSMHTKASYTWEAAWCVRTCLLVATAKPTDFASEHLILMLVTLQQ